MSDYLSFATYLVISPNKYEIYLIDLKSLKNLYKQEFLLKNYTTKINLNYLNNFLEENIFNIEKSIKQFIKNIFLIIDCDDVNNIEIGIRKKNYEKNINKKQIENAVKEIQDLLIDNNKNLQIMHIIIKNLLIDGNYYSNYVDGKNYDNVCIELKFITVKNKLILEIDKILEKYQIKILRCLDGNYIKSFSEQKNSKFIQMAHKIQLGKNNNEVAIVAKNRKKLAFFEKFFQLFS